MSKPRMRMTMRDGHCVPVSIRQESVRSHYEGASRGRRMNTKGASLTGPNTAIAHSLPLLQSRSHNAIRNNAYAQGAMETYVANLVGTGIKPRWRNEKIQQLWDRWMMECDADEHDSFYGLQALAAGAQFEAGEVLGRFRYRRTSDGLSVPLQLQVIESDHLDPNYTHLAAGFPGRLIKMGIEFNAIGQRTAFHLWRYHPAEAISLEINQRVAVPASDIVHMFRRTRPGQLRGVPALTSVLVSLYDIDEMQDATLQKQKLAQLFGAFVKRKADADPEEEGPFFGTHVTAPEERGEGISEFEPGGIHYLDDGEEVTFSNPADVGGNYTGYLRTELLRFARGAGLTYEQLTGDLSGVNYSSIRAGLLEFRRRAEALQAHLIVHRWCRPIAAKWLDVAVTSGALNIPDYWAKRSSLLAIDWIAPKWEWVDPLKEVTADKMEVRAGFAPRSEKAAARGWDIEELDRETDAGNKSADRFGLIYDSDPRRAAGNGTVQDASKVTDITEEDS